MPNKKKPEHGKVMPQALDLERSVLGTVMRTKDAIYEVDHLLTTKSFYLDQHQLIWEAITKLSNKRSPIDILTVGEQLKAMGALERAGGPFNISQLTDNVSSIGSIQHHAAILVQKQMKRQIIELDGLINDAYNDTVDPFELKNNIEKAVLNINSHIQSSKTVTMGQAFEEFTRDLEAGDGEIKGLRTGFKSLDNVLLGMDEADLVLLAARPGMGKTAAALQIADYIADQGEYVPFVTIEMSPKQLFQRRVARTTKIPLGRFKRSKDLTQADWGKLAGFTGQLIKEGLEFEDCASLDILQFKSMARKFVKEKGARIIFLDYIQLMKVPGVTDPVQVITEISQQLKAIAKELNIVIVALSQLSRPPKGQKVSPPTLTDLRGSGSLEQDADKVIFLHRFDYYDEEDRPGVCEWIVAKNRSGGLDVLEFMFEGQYLLFSEDVFPMPEIDDNDPHIQGIRDIGESGQKDFQWEE